MSYTPLGPSETFLEAWLTALNLLTEVPYGNLHNLILHINKPFLVKPREKLVLKKIDDFYVENGKKNLNAISDSIFPASVFNNIFNLEIDSLTEQYKEEYSKGNVSCSTWGSYFLRMVGWDIQDNLKINQLENIIDNLSNHHNEKSINKVYEVIINNPETDCKVNMNRDCADTIFVTPTKEILNMTVVYRNHLYLYKALGNIYGLSNLLKYISTHSELKIGTLTILSSNAYIGGTKEKSKELISRCQVND